MSKTPDETQRRPSLPPLVSMPGLAPRAPLSAHPLPGPTRSNTLAGLAPPKPPRDALKQTVRGIPAPSPAAKLVIPKSDPFPGDEAPTPVRGISPIARTFRNYEQLSLENKRLVDALVLALRETSDGGR